MNVRIGKKERARSRMSWKDKRVLVTGGAGVIGRELIQILSGLGADILCIDRKSRPRDIPKQVKYFRKDISIMNMAVVSRFNPEIIFHLAASFERTEETPDFWKINYRDNIVASSRVIGAARKLAGLKKFIFASSYLIYSPELYLTDRPRKTAYKLKEGDIINTRNLTGTVKYLAEKEMDFIDITLGRFINVSARIFRVYGRGSNDIISRWVRMALKGQQIKIYNKRNMFDYIYSRDVALGLIKLAETAKRSLKVNLGSGRSECIETVFKILQKAFSGLRVKELVNTLPFESSCADMSKFKKITGWQPNTDLLQGIRKITDYENSHIK